MDKIKMILKVYPYFAYFPELHGEKTMATYWFGRLVKELDMKGINAIIAELEESFMNAADKKQFAACHQVLFDELNQLPAWDLFGPDPLDDPVARRSYFRIVKQGTIMLDWLRYWVEMLNQEPLIRFVTRCSRLVVYPGQKGELITLSHGREFWKLLYKNAWNDFSDAVQRSMDPRFSIILRQLVALLPEISMLAPWEWKRQVDEATRYSGIEPPLPRWKKRPLRSRTARRKRFTERRHGKPVIRQSTGYTQYDLVPAEKQHLCGMPNIGAEELAAKWVVLRPVWLYKSGLLDDRGRRPVGYSAFDFDFYRNVMDSFGWRELYTCWAISLLGELLNDQNIPPIPEHLQIDPVVLRRMLAVADADDSSISDILDLEAPAPSQQPVQTKESPYLEPVPASLLPANGNTPAPASDQPETIYSILKGTAAEKKRIEARIRKYLGSKYLGLYEEGATPRKDEETAKDWSCFFWAIMRNGYIPDTISLDKAIELLADTYPEAKASLPGRSTLGHYGTKTRVQKDDLDLDVKKRSNELKNIS